jgi:hypothetical protein
MVGGTVTKCVGNGIDVDRRGIGYNICTDNILSQL